MRSAAGYGMAGVALWRLGGEDPRTWRFFANDLSDTAAAQGILDERPVPRRAGENRHRLRGGG